MKMQNMLKVVPMLYLGKEKGISIFRNPLFL